MGRRKEQKKQLRHKLDTWDMYDFEYSLASLEEKIKNFKARFASYGDFQIEHREEHGYYDATYHYFDIYGYRFETDEEFEVRKEKNRIARQKERERKAKEKAEKVEKEKAELAKLMKKYPEIVHNSEEE